MAIRHRRSVRMTDEEVYMVRAGSVSRFPLLDRGQQELVVENGNNVDRTSSGMNEQAGKLIPFVGVE